MDLIVKTTMLHRDPSVALGLRRGRVHHLEVPGTRGATGPIISLTGRPNWESTTACGERVLSTQAGFQAINITCSACREAAGLEPLES